MIKIINLLPELLGTYGDQGNVAVLSWRLRARGIENQIINATARTEIPTNGDFYFLGGGEDDAQVAAVDILRGGALQAALDNGAQIFAVCAGFQLLGESFPASNNRIIPGLNLLPIKTESATPRSVGELLGESTLPIGVLSGFENHSGQTKFTDRLQPLSIVQFGIGNHISEKCDGVVTDQIIATYMHGPALVRNPALADYLLNRHAGLAGKLNEIDDEVFKKLHAERVAATR